MSNFNNYSTTYIDISGQGYTCVYCGNQHLEIDDAFGEYGDYQGTRYYCDCEKAKIEQEMKRELELKEKDIQKIRDSYKDKLEYDLNKIKALKFNGEFKDFLQMNSYDIDFENMKVEYLLELVESAFREWLSDKQY